MLSVKSITPWAIDYTLTKLASGQGPEAKESRRVAAVSAPSPFGQNEWLVEEMYRKFREDPSSVDPSWHEFLVDYSPESTAGTTTEPAKAPASAAASAPTAPREPGPAPAPKAATDGNGAGPAKAEPAAAKAEPAAAKADRAPAKAAAPPATTQPPTDKTDVAPAKPAAAERKPAEKAAPSADGDEAQVLRGAAAAVVKNMSASLDVPTATSVRAIPAK